MSKHLDDGDPGSKAPPPPSPPRAPPPTYIGFDWGFPKIPKNFSLVDFVGEIVYGIRYTLMPMYLLLWVVMIAYNVQFAKEIIVFLFTSTSTFPWIGLRENDAEHYLIMALSLIDISMIGNLIVMTTVGGYSTFVKEFDQSKLDGKPRWMNGLDSTTLKNKMGMSLIGVSAIHLLKVFMEIGREFASLYDKVKMQLEANTLQPIFLSGVWTQAGLLTVSVTVQLVIHIAFIFTTLGFAKNNNMMHSHKSGADAVH